MIEKIKYKLYKMWLFMEEAKKGSTIYAIRNARLSGAIWTSKGLIYVTKLNEKGELELI